MVKKLIKNFLITLTVIFMLYFISVFVTHCYVGHCMENDVPFRFLGNKYVEFDSQFDANSFVPFGDYNCFYRDNVKFSSLLGFRFLEKDRNINFIYDHTPLGTTVYKRTDYNIPKNPQSTDIDKIIIFDNEQNDEAVIAEPRDIVNLVNYFNAIRGSFSATEKAQIIIHAVSYKNGGVFELTGDGRNVFITPKNKLCHLTLSGVIELPDEIQKIIKTNLKDK